MVVTDSSNLFQETDVLKFNGFGLFLCKVLEVSVAPSVAVVHTTSLMCVSEVQGETMGAWVKVEGELATREMSDSCWRDEMLKWNAWQRDSAWLRGGGEGERNLTGKG